MAILTAARGREPVGISQEPGQGGYNYPLLFPSADVAKLLADLYLAYVDNLGQFALPFHIEFLHGFGDTVVAVPITPAHTHDMRIRDANDQVVFDTLTVSAGNFRSVVWDSRMTVLEWKDDNGQILRVVYHTHWDVNDSDAREYDIYIAPASAVLDGRALYHTPKRVTSLRVGLSTISPDDDGEGVNVELLNGFNTEIAVDALNTDAIDGGRRATRLTFNIRAGTGQGRFGPGCDETIIQPLRRINNIVPTTRGNFLFDTTGCYRIEQPVHGIIDVGESNVSPRELQIRDHSLQISNDCGPCCECQDFINVWEAIRQQRDRYAGLVSRAQAARDQYHANRERWLTDAACRLSDRVRAILQPTESNQLGVSVGLCNTELDCLIGVVFQISFDYADGTGKCKDAIDSTKPFFADSTASFVKLLPGTTFRSGNVDPQNPSTGGRPSQQEFYQLSGSYPHYWAYFDAINPGSLGSVTFRQQWSPGDAANTDVIEMIVETFLVGPNPVIQPNGTFVTGYQLGQGPLSTPDSQRLQTCPIKRAAGLIPAFEVSDSLSFN